MNMLLAGPSQVGIETPAHYTVVSLIQISAALLNFKPTMDGIIVTRTMHKYADRVEEALVVVAEKLREELNTD